jgi:ligand-binding sensor domain-containing protein
VDDEHIAILTRDNNDSCWIHSKNGMGIEASGTQQVSICFNHKWYK